MPMYDYKCSKCLKVEEILIGSHVTSEDLNCECGGTFERLFTPSKIPSEVMGGYDYQYGKKSNMNSTNHKANWLSDSSVSPY
jgi:putative FmdB family regulatory protein